MKNKIIIIGLILLISGGITYQLVANKQIINENSKLEDTSHIAIPVNVITTKTTIPNSTIIASGMLIPDKEASIATVSSGRLTQVNFKEGDMVRKGQVLAVVDTEMLALNLDAAIIARDQAKKDYERFKALYEGEAATEQNYQNAKLNYENAKNQVAQINKQIADNKIKAPISGQILSQLKEEGEFVSTGTVLGDIVGVEDLKVSVMVSEENIYALELNDSVTITTDAFPLEKYEGKISFISFKADAVHNYKVEVTLKNKTENKLRAGTFSYVQFDKDNSNPAILIPKSALIESMDNPKVYTVVENRAVVKNIVLGKTYDSKVEVLDGLTTGEVIVTTGLVNISEGTLLQPLAQ